jgi:hypothetical protein
VINAAPSDIAALPANYVRVADGVVLHKGDTQDETCLVWFNGQPVGLAEAVKTGPDGFVVHLVRSAGLQDRACRREFLEGTVVAYRPG